jgi:ankyrin repeat protein
MPKNNKLVKSKRQEAESDDFDDMLADLRAADLTSCATTFSVPVVTTGSAISSTSTASTSSSSRTNNTTTTAVGMRSVRGEDVSQESIVEASRIGDMAQLQRWARQGFRVSSPDPLVHAAASGRLDVLRFLVEKLGADVNRAASGGKTALYISSRYGHVAIVVYLAKVLGADVNQAKEVGETPLHTAAQNGHFAVVGILAKEFGADVNSLNQMIDTPLIIAAHEGHADVVYCLIKELGADVNLVGHDCNTPLIMAAQSDQLDAVMCLGNELGADVSLSRPDGSTPLHFAALKGHLDVIHFLVEELGADVNQATHDGHTALGAASAGKNKFIAAYIIKKCANPHASNSAFGTAADVSLRFGASVSQIAYLEAKMHCSHPSCNGAGIKKCTGCKQARYCGQKCQLAHWPAHKANCKLQGVDTEKTK